jgi:G3E family GTPase
VPSELVLGVGGSETPAAGHDHDGHHHAAFESWSYASDRPLSLEAFRAAVRDLPTTVIRGKGILHVDEHPAERLVFQLVGTRTTITPAGRWASEPRTELVLIGPEGGLDEPALERLLATCATQR